MQELINKAESYLNMNWLRPEGVVWLTSAYHLISPVLQSREDILELGIGNGYNSFMMLDGEFNKEYDWYFNVNTQGFWENKDIFNSLNSAVNIADFIEKKPVKRIKQAVDHKVNLLDQARQLNFVDEIKLADGNEIFSFSGIRTVYSNILYWLNDPFVVLENLARQLEIQDQIIIVFPNPRFYEYCKSYTTDTPFWNLLNRGRKDCMMWNLDLANFEKQLQSKLPHLKVKTFNTYLTKQTLQVWDVGLRPISPHLIKMANKLSINDRNEIKQEWCQDNMKIITTLLENELEKAPQEGAYNFVILEKC